MVERPRENAGLQGRDEVPRREEGESPLESSAIEFPSRVSIESILADSCKIDVYRSGDADVVVVAPQPGQDYSWGSEGVTCLQSVLQYLSESPQFVFHLPLSIPFDDEVVTSIVTRLVQSRLHSSVGLDLDPIKLVTTDGHRWKMRLPDIGLRKPLIAAYSDLEEALDVDGTKAVHDLGASNELRTNGTLHRYVSDDIEAKWSRLRSIRALSDESTNSLRESDAPALIYSSDTPLDDGYIEASINRDLLTDGKRVPKCGALSDLLVEQLEELCKLAIEQKQGVKISFSGCSFIGPEIIGTLSEITVRLKDEGGRTVYLSDVEPHVLKKLRLGHWIEGGRLCLWENSGRAA